MKFRKLLIFAHLIIFFIAANGDLDAQILDVSYTTTQPGNFDTAGSISLSISGGVFPYAITWCDFGTTGITSYQGLKSGIYNVKVEDSIGNIAWLSIPLTPDVSWDSIYFQRTQNQLQKGENGWAQFTVPDTSLKLEMGLVHDAPSDSFPVDTIIISAGFSFLNDTVKVIFDGAERSLPVPLCILKAGSIFKVERSGDQFNYFINSLKVYSAHSNYEEDLGEPSMRLGYRSARGDVDRGGSDIIYIEGTFLPDFHPITTFYIPFLSFYYTHDASCNRDLNWVYSETYDGNNIPVTAGIQFYDLFGRAIQAQQMNTAANKVFCSETRYDNFGRKAITTLPAPTLTNNFCYVPHFMTTDVEISVEGATSVVNFDYQPFAYDDVQTLATLNNPYKVSQTTQGQLGWYYSNNNTLESRVASSSFPYSRVEYYADPLGNVKRASSVGEAFRMGAGHEIKSFVMPQSGELDYVYGFQEIYCKAYSEPYNFHDDFSYTSSPEGACENIFTKLDAYKYIVVDQNGQETITFKDINGKVLATCLSGPENDENVHTQHVNITIQPGEYADIHLPQGCENSLVFASGGVSAYRIENIDRNFVNVTSAFTATPYSGFFRIYNTATDGSWLKAIYYLNYYNFALYYYDAAARPIATVPPEGVDYSYDPGVSTYQFGYNKLLSECALTISTPLTYSADLNTSVAYTATPSGKYESGHGAVYLADNTVITANSGAGCYYCGSSTGAVSSLPANLFKGKLTAPAHHFVNPLDDLVCSGAKKAYSFKVQLYAEGAGHREAITEPIILNAFYLTGTCTDASGTSVTPGAWVFDPATSYQEFDISQQQSSWCTGITCSLLDVTFTNYVLTSGIEKFDSSIDPWDPNDDDALYSLYLTIQGTRVVLTDPSPAHTMINTKQYNTLMQQQWNYTPDAHRADLLYRRDGQVRFSQNAEQRTSHKFSYFNYDISGRAIEVGEYDPSVNYGTSGTDVCNNIAGNNSAIFFSPVLVNPSEFNSCFGTYPFDPSSHTYRFAANMVDDVDNIEDTRCNDVIRTLYDQPDDGLHTLDASLFNRYQRHWDGKISRISRFYHGTDASPYSSFWFSYDELGRKEWEVNYLAGVGYTTTDYTYDFNGNITQHVFQKNVSNETFKHLYTYDQAKRLTSVVTRDEHSHSLTQANYKYYLHGPLKRAEIAGMQGLDYTYTLPGALKGINTAELTTSTDPGGDGATGSIFQPDLFGMELDYYANDYQRNYVSITDGMYSGNAYAEQFNGNLKSVRWKTSGVSPMPVNVGGITSTPDQNMYGCTYDVKRNWMKASVMGSYDPQRPGTPFPIAANYWASDYYKEFDISYSMNGNITALKRHGNSSAVDIDDLAYNYYPSGNQLQFVADNASNDGSLNDIVNQDPAHVSPNNYVYNAIGQMITDAADNYTVEYNAYGKMAMIKDNSSVHRKKVSYLYDAVGNKVAKTDFEDNSFNAPTNFTYYSVDASGMVNRIVNENAVSAGHPDQQFETPIYGLGRVGLRLSSNYYRSGAYAQTGAFTRYELTDNIGNVRAVFQAGPVDPNGHATAVIKDQADYYPMGMVQPGRQEISAEGYRFGYQGQNAEKCEETGLNDFQLRSYDARIGRWLTMDPKGQFWSPYEGMGNNWASIIDKDGGGVGYAYENNDDCSIILLPKEAAAPDGYTMISETMETWGGLGDNDYAELAKTDPVAYMFSVPKSAAGYEFEHNMQEGGKDAAIFLGVGIGTPYAIGYGAVYATAAWESQVVLNARVYAYFQATRTLGMLSGGAGATVLLGRNMAQVVNPMAQSEGWTTLSEDMPTWVSATQNTQAIGTYNALWLRYQIASGATINLVNNAFTSYNSYFMKLEFTILGSEGVDYNIVSPVISH